MTMKKSTFLILGLLALLLILVISFFLLHLNKGKSAEPTELIVSAAVSLQKGLEIAKPLYEAAHPNVKLIFNFGSSGALQQQMEQGAPVDVFLSAGQEQMDGLINKDLIRTSQTILTNELVLIIPSDNHRDWTSLESLTTDEVATIAIGQPESVPAGLYAQQALKALGLWDKLQSKLVFAKDVRQVLTYVETGNAEAGFVYKTDALLSTKSIKRINVPTDLHQPILYPAGILMDSKHQTEALAFYNYLTRKEAKSVFIGLGFREP
jgi:molybdate transport system substrate-binding protein